MNITLMCATPEAEEIIEKACRICYDSRPNEVTRQDFIRSIIKRGHESVIEHASATFEVTGVSRALTHQLVRHRLASYSQRSQRYVKENRFDYVIPLSVKKDVTSTTRYCTLMDAIGETYQQLVNLGIPAEDARMVLPNACHTSIIMTMNFREYRHFFKVRCDKHAQWEIREMATDMLDLLARYVSPAVFGDLAKIYCPEE